LKLQAATWKRSDACYYASCSMLWLRRVNTCKKYLDAWCIKRWVSLSLGHVYCLTKKSILTKRLTTSIWGDFAASIWRLVSQETSSVEKIVKKLA
jgi:hypothetical protein